jgi:DNA uptake protein ComE-like DNA-binding protein
MKKFKSHFWYNKSQRNGVFFLALIIIGLQLIYFFVDFSSDEKTDLNSEELIQFQEEIDSLKVIELENRKPKLFPFNPSFINDFKGYQLGMSVKEIDQLLAHRAAGKYINSVAEFQQVTKISDSLLAIISPYFKFPDWVEKRQQLKTTPSTKSTTSKNYSIRDLNTVSTQELTEINGIGVKLAERIINYRNKLGGFLIDSQLYEVYYLDRAVADKVLAQFNILTKVEIKKININEASFKKVLSIVYIDFELTKKIFEYKDEVAEIQSLEELKKIDGFPLEKFDRIALYLDVK